MTAPPEDSLDVSSGIKPSRSARFIWKAGEVDILTEQEARDVFGDEVIDEAKLAAQQSQVNAFAATAHDVAVDSDLHLDDKIAKIRQLEREAATALGTDAVDAISCYLELAVMRDSARDG